MPTITTADGVEIFYKDWGSGQPIVFSHGWPLSSDDWDPQLMFFLSQGYRVLAADRRGHGWSGQVSDGRLAAGPFYGFNRPRVEASEAIVGNWWRQGMTGSAKAHYDGIVAFSQTDFTEDLKQISVPVLIMHGDDDQIVPYADSGPLSAKLVQNGTLKTYQLPGSTPAPWSSWWSRLTAALIRARWLKACGKLPSCSPVAPISSEYRPRWLA
jgi:pimeloyl-ACP methyl ester carboxylesterase